MKPEILILCNRVPYPPDKGDKIRSFNVLRFLAERYSIILGAFVDDSGDRKHLPYLESICKECKFIDIRRGVSYARYARGLLSNEPLTSAYYRDRRMSRWIGEQLASNSVTACLASSSGMAQYFIKRAGSKYPARLVDFVDIDSDKWRQYAVTASFPLKQIYDREANLLEELEAKICASFDHSFFVSEEEAKSFANIHPELESRIDYFCNGVDLDYFDGVRAPNEQNDRVAVFTGAMDYRPNIDAVCWFASEVLPVIRDRDPRWEFVIVGSNPSREVRKLASRAGVTVTGRVPDVRPYLAKATAAVAPIRIARGVQNKVLEAMAMRTPTVASPQAIKGIPALDRVEVLIADNVCDFSECLEEIAGGDHQMLGSAGRTFIERRFSWTNNLATLDAIVKSNVK